MKEANCLHHGFFLDCKKQSGDAASCSSCCLEPKSKCRRVYFSWLRWWNLHFYSRWDECLPVLMATYLNNISYSISNTCIFTNRCIFFFERVPSELCCQGGLLRRKTTRGDNAIGNFIWLAVGHRNPHSWGKSRDNASGRAWLRTGDEELCVATLWSHSQTKECRHNLICS